MSTYVLKDKYALVTGASSGIGKELSLRLAEEGCHCALGGLPGEREILEDWGKELHDRHGVKTWPIPVDLAEKDGPQRVHEDVTEQIPRLDVLVNNAGVLTYGPFHEVDLDKSERMLMVNARAYLALMRLFLPGMLERGDGRILNVSSVSAFQPTAHHAAYAATKAFVQSLSEAVREEIRGTGVVVCTLAPGYTDTPLIRGSGFPKRLWWYSISGLGDPSEIARQGVKALKGGKAVCIPGWRNWALHSFFPRFTPRRLGPMISRYALRGRSD